MFINGILSIQVLKEDWGCSLLAIPCAWIVHVELVVGGQVSAEVELVLVVLEVVAALLRGATWELIGDYLPVSAVDLEELDELLLLVSLPLVLGLDAAAEEGWLVHRSCDLPTRLIADANERVVEMVQVLVLSLAVLQYLHWSRRQLLGVVCFSVLQVSRWSMTAMMVMTLTKHWAALRRLMRPSPKGSWPWCLERPGLVLFGSFGHRLVHASRSTSLRLRLRFFYEPLHIKLHL